MVVSQPGKPKGRGNKTVPVPSPVEQLARDAGFGDDRIMCPARARDVGRGRAGTSRGALRACAGTGRSGSASAA